MNDVKKMKKSTIIVIIAAVLVAVVIAYSCAVSANKKNGFGKKSANQTTFSVKTQTASVSTLHDFVNTNGEVESQNSVEVFPDIGGKVVSTSVQLGSPVKKGDVIAKIDPSEPGSHYALSPVYAPISGSIVSTPLKNGTKVTTNSEITTIGDISNLQVTAQIPERYVATLKTGLKADIVLEAYPSAVFPATVIRVSPVVDATSRTKEVILSFDRSDSHINAGMFAKVTLYTLDYNGEITVPQDAVVTKGDKPYLFVLKDGGTVSQREVILGKSVDGTVQILKGISKGEKVIVEGEQVLSDGSKVKDITNGVTSDSSDVKKDGNW